MPSCWTAGTDWPRAHAGVASISLNCELRLNRGDVNCRFRAKQCADHSHTIACRRQRPSLRLLHPWCFIFIDDMCSHMLHCQGTYGALRQLHSIKAQTAASSAAFPALAVHCPQLTLQACARKAVQIHSSGARPMRLSSTAFQRMAHLQLC